MSFRPALGQSRAAVPSARLRAVLGSLVLLAVVLVPLGVSSVAVAAPAGFDWTIRASAANNYWASVTYGNGLFVAVAGSGTGNRVMTSPDGITWTSRTSPADNGWSSVTYGGGLFVAVANDSSPNGVMTSPDGITWTSRTSAANNAWYSVTYGNGLFVAASAGFFGGNGNRVMTSPDGITWTSQTSAANNDWYSVTYGNGLFVAVSITGTGNRVMTSPDGITWTTRTSAADNQWRSVTYGGGLFVAVSSTGTGNRVMTSPDGITWTSRTSAADNAWSSVTYGGGLFVAVANSGTGNRVMTSPDGITWTTRTSAADNDWRSVTYGGGTFVAVSSTGSGNRVMTSVGTPPGAPVITGVTAGQTSAQVAFTADDSGGSTITRLEFALDDTTAVDDSTTSLSSPYTLSNLSPGTAYTVYMRAVNAVGTGPWSAPQGFVTSSPVPPPVFPPGAPTGAIAVAGDRSASVSWVAPTSAGSFPVTNYEVASAPTGGSCLVKAPATSCTVTGLANGTSYTFTVRALNGAGWGAWSASSNAVTPQAAVTKSILITGSRDASDSRVVRVSGATTGLVGELVMPWVRFTGEGSYSAGSGVKTVDAAGRFDWSRRTGKKVHVYFTHGSIKSNTVVIPAR